MASKSVCFYLCVDGVILGVLCVCGVCVLVSACVWHPCVGVCGMQAVLRVGFLGSWEHPQDSMASAQGSKASQERAGREAAGRKQESGGRTGRSLHSVLKACAQH